MEDKKEKNVEARSKRKGAGLGSRIILRIVTIIVIALIVLGGGYFGLKRFTTVSFLTARNW